MRFVLYFAFILFAAPIDSVLDVWAGYVHSDTEQMSRPLAEALVYIYAFILSVETMFRVEQHHDVIILKPWVRITQLLAAIVIFFFIIDYMNVLRPVVLDHKSAIDSATRQIAVGCIALCASILSFIACESKKMATLNVQTDLSSTSRSGVPQ